jgi:hypothetical protein
MMRRLTGAMLSAGVLVAMLPGAVAADKPFALFVDALCYDGGGQFMDRSRLVSSLGEWKHYARDLERIAIDDDVMDGICTPDTLFVNGIYKVSL